MASGITHISAGVNHVLALRSDGTVLAWGDDSAGEMGTVPRARVRRCPRKSPA